MPAFGSLRVGLRMKRVATVLSGSACCVYGLTFVSHFYGARRSVGYVPFNSETLVTGKLFEDIRDSVHELADPDRFDAIVVTNLCVPTASGVPLRLLPKEINGVRIVGIDVPGFGIPTHAEAKDVLAGAMLNYARAGGRGRPGARPRGRRVGPADRDAAGRDVSRRPDDDRSRCWRRWGWPPGRWCRAASGASFTPRSIVARWRRSIRSTPPRSANSRRRAGPSSAARPVGHDGTAAWLAGIGEAFGLPADKVAAAQNAFLPAIEEAFAAAPVKGTDHALGLRGQRSLLVARLLIESGAEVPYVGTACPKTPWSEAMPSGCAPGRAVKFRASLEDDCAAMEG